MQHGVAVEEGAAADVFAGEAHAVALREQAGVGEVLAHAPVEGHFAPAHGRAVVDDLLDARVQREVRRDRAQALGQALDLLHRHGGVALVGVGLLDVRRPVGGELAVVAREHRVVQQLALVEVLAVLGDHLVGLVGLQRALGDQAVGVELAGAGVLLDGAVHQRLGHHRLVLLVVAELAEADDVDHHVLLELLAELDRQRGDQGHGLGVVAIDVEDRRLDHLEDVGAVQRRAVVARVGGGEADLVVDDQVHRAARAVAAGLREVEHFLVDALAGHGGVAVDQHRQHLVLVGVAATDLAGIHRTLDHRVDDLEVRGVERERQVHRAARGHHVAREAHVVLHVAGGEVGGGLALELREQHRGRLAQGVDEHVETAAVGHADHAFLHAQTAGDADQLVHRDDGRLAAFEREALLADVAGMQVALEGLGGGGALEDALLHLGRELRRAAQALEAALDPALLTDVGHVHVLGADRAAVGLAQRLEDLAQGGALGAEAVEGADVEALGEIGLGEAVVGRLEFGDLRALGALERVEVGPAVAEEAIGVDQLQHGDLLLVLASGDDGAHRAALGHLLEGGDDRAVRHVARGGADLRLQLVEIVAPLGGDRGRVGEVVFVLFFDERRVRAEQVRSLFELLHHGISTCGVLLPCFRVRECGRRMGSDGKTGWPRTRNHPVTVSRGGSCSPSSSSLTDAARAPAHRGARCRRRADADGRSCTRDR